MFILDFDDMLFDTQRYKIARMQALLPLGVDENLFWKTYKEARNDAEHVVYSNISHGRVLDHYGFDYDTVFTYFETLDETLPSFLNDQTIAFLKWIQQQDQRMILLSLGEKNFQEKKVRQSGIADYFDAIHFVSASKLDIIDTLYTDDETIYFINDKVQETIEIKTKHPKIHCILKHSPIIPREDYETSNMPHFTHLIEIQDYVSTLIN